MQFPTTCWEELARASLNGDTQARGALEGLCRRYYAPVRQFIRWRGYAETEAEDLAQEFFLQFLEDATWKRAERMRGTFRSFLLGSLTNHLADVERARRRQKRGGGALPVSLDEHAPDDNPDLPHLPATDEMNFDRAWAVGLVDASLKRVQEAYSDPEKMTLYRELKVFLPGADGPPPYEETAARLGLTLAGLKTQIHRLRQNFRRALRDEVATTVSAPHEVDPELRYLQSVLLQGPADPSTHAKPK
jgi:DNA-directed RNA polymerase specialized sigma24 family protein